jgi:hypothetical protein
MPVRSTSGEDAMDDARSGDRTARDTIRMRFWKLGFFMGA